ncbi:ankyrin repeat domain-containing protein [Pseudomonas anguilliseptica]|uniref:ankyrin repeat domain-containing protein n=1 Tax=Pseudomonas anguilliseptica TaxID=53406 RepID=UPI001F36B4DC|nr:ankyrin repeat domain-containing protein [Pseudomonas anguilliseptica]MCE5364983.1 ankyrin repeat domain-containing protein [Pseudomonas anguilliseptica]
MNTDKDLSDRYYTAEKFLWFISLITILSTFYGDQETPIKLIEFEFKNYQDSTRAAIILLIAAAVYQLIEFNLSHIKNKTASQHIRISLSAALFCIALTTAYPIATQNTAYAEISLLWYLAFLVTSLLTGISVSMLAFSAIMIRTKEEAKQLKLPRIPFAVKSQLLLQASVLPLLITANITIFHYTPEPARPIGLFILLISVIYFTLSTTYQFLLKDKDSNKLQKLREAFNSHDHGYLLADQDSEHPEHLNELPPHELQKKISAHYSLPETPKNIEFQVKTLEPIGINFTPKKNTPQADPTFKLKKSTEKQSHLKVKIISNSKIISNRVLELPISALERNATEFLKNHKKGQDQSHQKAFNYALKQAAKIALMQPVSESQSIDFITTGNRSLISNYIDKKTDLNERAAYGWTPLMMAIAQGDLETAKTLLDLGADPDITNLQKRSALHFAARYANLESCLLLIEYGANLNIQDTRGNTPLIIATSYGSLEIVEALVSAGADTGIQNALKESALNLSQKLRHGKIAKILRKKTNKS